MRISIIKRCEFKDFHNQKYLIGKKALDNKTKFDKFTLHLNFSQSIYANATYKHFDLALGKINKIYNERSVN